MKSLNEDLKSGQLNNVYLLYGEEAYLKKQYRDKLRNAMISPDDNMNYAYYEGKGINVKEVIDLAETLPFFAENMHDAKISPQFSGKRLFFSCFYV